MLTMIESLLVDMIVLAPEYLLVVGVPELPPIRRKLFVTVRQGRQSVVVEA